MAIVHARWNTPIISALVAGAEKALAQSGVKRQNIVVQDVPGSWELPYAVQRYLLYRPALDSGIAPDRLLVHG